MGLIISRFCERKDFFVVIRIKFNEFIGDF